MDEIYVLKSKAGDYFGDGTEWVITGWTDDPRVAGRWRNSSHRDERRDFDRLKKVTPNGPASAGAW